MAQEFNRDLLGKAAVKAVRGIFDRVLHVQLSDEPQLVEKDVIEFDSRMRLFAMDKFNGPCFISVVSFHRSEKDQQDGHGMGVLAFYVKEEFIDKFLRPLDHSPKDAEHEDILMDVCGQVAAMIAESFQKELGVGGLMVASPVNYKNHVPSGVPFDFNCYHYQEASFLFWGQKSIVVDVCMGAVG